MARHSRKRPNTQSSSTEEKPAIKKRIREVIREREALRRVRDAERAHKYRKKKKIEPDRSECWSIHTSSRTLQFHLCQIYSLSGSSQQ